MLAPSPAPTMTEPSSGTPFQARPRKPIMDAKFKEDNTGIGLDNDGKLVVVENDGAADADFKESEHPRDSDGKFSNSSGGSSVVSPEENSKILQATVASYQAAIAPKIVEGFVKTAERLYEQNKAFCDSHKITPDEIAHIVTYTESGYVKLNKQLRADKIDPDLQKHTEILNLVLDKIPPSPGISYRKSNLPQAVFEAYQVGVEIEERGFTSTASNSDAWHGTYQYVIKGTGGRDLQKFSTEPESTGVASEILFKSGTRFRVTGKEGNTIHLEEVAGKQAHDAKELKAVGLIIVTKEGRALFLLRSEDGDHAGEWAFPAGKVEDGEEPEETIIREVCEETAWVPETDILELNNHTSDEDVDFTCFEVSVNNEFIPTLNEEHIGWCWAPLDNPPQPLHPGCETILDMALGAGLAEDLDAVLKNLHELT